MFRRVADETPKPLARQPERRDRLALVDVGLDDGSRGSVYPVPAAQDGGPCSFSNRGPGLLTNYTGIDPSVEVSRISAGFAGKMAEFDGFLGDLAVSAQTRPRRQLCSSNSRGGDNLGLVFARELEVADQHLAVDHRHPDVRPRAAYTSVDHGSRSGCRCGRRDRRRSGRRACRARSIRSLPPARASARRRASPSTATSRAGSAPGP